MPRLATVRPHRRLTHLPLDVVADAPGLRDDKVDRVKKIREVPLIVFHDEDVSKLGSGGRNRRDLSFGDDKRGLDSPVRSPPGQARILIVEDDTELRNLYRMALTAVGYAVVAVEDGLDALEHIDNAIPDAIVLDLALPRLSGADVRRELAAHHATANIPVIVVTGTDADDLDAKEFACVLRKPANINALITAVGKCITEAAERSRRHRTGNG
jgi:CheY-like chemotaxis protein